MIGIYIHIPFCKTRCIYCDFVSSTYGEEWQGRYLDAVEREIEQKSKAEGPFVARTIYIGGGTPSQLSSRNLLRLSSIIKEHFEIPEGTEFTIEANPDDVTPEFIEALKKTPVNRVSMGVQSLDDNILRTLRRRHNAQQAIDATRRLQDAGLTNLSLDLIYGLPGQHLDMFENDIKRIIGLGIPHISAYALQFEEGTALWKMKEQGLVDEADEELSLQCYQRLIDLTQEAGFEHYEISNFARNGYRSKHNSSYWQGLPYLGIGAGAHGYNGKDKRDYNHSDIQKYIRGEANPEPEILTKTDLYDERVMLSLRTMEGLDLQRLETDFGQDMRRFCERQAQPHILNGTLQKTGETLRLTRSGIFISDSIISDLFA